MQTLQEFQAKQAAELAKFQSQQALVNAVGEVPGLSWWIVHAKHRGWEHGAFKLADFKLALPWLKAHAVPLSAWEGKYKGFWPELPEPDYGSHVGTGAAELVTTKFLEGPTSAALHVFCAVAGRRVKVSFEVPLAREFHNLVAVPVFEHGGRGQDQERFKGWRKGWRKPRGHEYKQYIRSYDSMATLETLLLWEDVERMWL